MSKVLLIQPSLTPKELFARGSETSASIIPPLGIAYIATTHICVITISNVCVLSIKIFEYGSMGKPIKAQKNLIAQRLETSFLAVETRL